MVSQFAGLLDEFKRLPVHPDRLPTVMEIAGYPRYENVYSNILAFFFDPKKPHGLGTLFLDALAHIGGIQEQGEMISSNLEVEREEPTHAGNRIDILITSDSHAILIENKIGALIGNPFDDYSAYLDTLQPQQRSRHKFLLELWPSGSDVGYGFQNITYGQLVSEIRDRLGSYAIHADTRYLMFLLDFLNTIDNLQAGKVMDKEFLEFMALQRADVESLLDKIKKFKEELRTAISHLAEKIDVKSYDNVNQWKYRDPAGLCDTLVHDIDLGQAPLVAIDATLSAEGWKIEIFSREPGSRAELRNLLQRLDISFEEDGRFTIHPNFGYSANLDQIRDVVLDLVDKIAKSGNAAEMESKTSG